MREFRKQQVASTPPDIQKPQVGVRLLYADLRGFYVQRVHANADARYATLNP